MPGIRKGFLGEELGADGEQEPLFTAAKEGWGHLVRVLQEAGPCVCCVLRSVRSGP